MYNNRYDERARGRDLSYPSNSFSGREDDNYRDNFSAKRSNYPDRMDDSYSYQGGSAAKRARDMPSGNESYLGASRGTTGILDTPRYERSLLLAEEERLRQLEEIAQLKREHELTLLRRTLDMNRREVQAALNSRDDSRSYGRDRQLDYDRRGGGGFGERRDMGRDGGRFRRDSPPRGGQRRDRSPVRRRSPMNNRGSNSSNSNNRRSNSRNRRSRDRSRARNQQDKNDSRTSKAQEPPKPQEFKCELCNIKFNSNEEKVEHEERNEKHINVMKRLQAFSETSGTTMDELIERFLKSRKQTSEAGAVSSCAPSAVEKSKEDVKTGDARGAETTETNQEKAAETEEKKPENDPNRFPGLFYTGERWRVRVYNPDLILGSDFIVPATGWYCVLCQKFYYSESPAKTSHCRNKSHWENLRSWLKVNGHRYEPNQYEKFLKEEERHKEELRNKRKQTDKTDNESEKSQQATDNSSSQEGKIEETGKIVTGGKIGDSEKLACEQKEDNIAKTEAVKDEEETDKGTTVAVKEEEIGSAHFGGPPQEIYFETDIGSPIKAEPVETDTGCDDALDFDYEEEDYDDEGALISRNKDLESKISMSANDNAEYGGDSNTQTEGTLREGDEAGGSGGDQEGKRERLTPSTVESSSNRTKDVDGGSKSLRKDADMLMMFDNLEEILNGPEEEEITVNVVEEDPFHSPSRQYEDEREEAVAEVMEDLQEPPIEEIRMDNGDDDLFDYEVREEDDVIEQQSPPKQRVWSEEVDNPTNSLSESQPPTLSIIEDLPNEPELAQPVLTPASPVEENTPEEFHVPSPTRNSTRRGGPAVGNNARVARGARRTLRR